MLDRIAASRNDVGYPAWKVAILAVVAKLLGVQFKIFGLPFGGSYSPEIAHKAMGPLTSMRPGRELDRLGTSDTPNARPT